MPKVVILLENLDSELLESINSNLNAVVRNQALLFVQQKAMLEELRAISETLEKAAADWVDSLTAAVSNYKFKLQQTIYTEEEPEIHQHFIVVKLQYEYID